jgi:hypothetical protein
VQDPSLEDMVSQTEAALSRTSGFGRRMCCWKCAGESLVVNWEAKRSSRRAWLVAGRRASLFWRRFGDVVVVSIGASSAVYAQKGLLARF